VITNEGKKGEECRNAMSGWCIGKSRKKKRSKGSENLIYHEPSGSQSTQWKGRGSDIKKGLRGQRDSPREDEEVGWSIKAPLNPQLWLKSKGGGG